ncbi:hypothetical protein [Deinococcus sp.]|uniref:hypothetical protein n=1 Tax=Deinococcus sp. TaxID=47478 RepID=UPI0025DA16DD|nr:hypothetical protein [Deinococcus sp.]
MTRFPLLLLTALCLSACQSGQDETRLADLDVAAVSLPASVGATEPLTLNITLGSNCSELPPQQFKVQRRTADALFLLAQTTITIGNGGPICPPIYFHSKQTYTDPGSPTRTNPFEVFVNGKSYGTVKIDPPAAPITRDATIETVTLPDKTSASAVLPIPIRLVRGACERFRGFEVQERTPGRLKLLAVLEDNRPAGQVQLPCPAIAILEDQTYTDPGSPARTSPFEVFVNGKSYGTVSVK